MVDPKHKAAERLCNRIKDIHDRRTNGVVLLVAALAIASTGGNGVDEDGP